MWYRIYADRFGSTNLIFLLVLVSFIGGLGLGSLVSRRLARAAESLRLVRNPLALVGVIEMGIACTALLTLVIHPSGSGLAGDFPYRPDARGILVPVLQLRLLAGLSAVSMFLPTFLMGTTFPILCHAFRSRTVFPSELYAWNTLGACLGILASEFILLAYVGHTRSFMMLAAANLVLGLTFIGFSRSRLGRYVAGQPRFPGDGDRARERAGHKSRKTPAERPRPALVFHGTVILAAAALSGFVSGALEVDMFRAVRFAGAITDAAMSFTAFWAIVAIFLASAAVRALGRPRAFMVRFALLGVLAAHAITWLRWPMIREWFNQRYMAWVAAHAHADPSVAEAIIYPLSASLPLLLAFTGVIVFPAYFMVSLLLPTVCNAAQSRKQHLGLTYGLNTLAFCLGAILFTWIAPGVSLFYAVKLLFVVIAVAAGLALALRPRRPVPRLAVGVAVVAAAVGAILVPGGFDKGFFPSHEFPGHYPVRAMKSNGTHTTYIVEHPRGDILYFDSHPMSGTWAPAQRYMRLMAHMPLLAQEEPRKALLICFGVGNTAEAIASHETIRQIDIVDLNDKVYETADEFAATNGLAHRDPRARLIHDDGRSFLERVSEKYDLVTSEPPPPRSVGVYRLYSVEYYRSVLEHLTPDGMMTQWLPVNSLSGTAVDRVISSFVSVFPHTLLFIGDGEGEQMILMGGRKPFDPVLLEKRFAGSPGAREDLAGIDIREPTSLLARIIRMGEDLRRDVRGARVISDQRNDLALAVTDPFDAPVLVIDMRRVLRALQPERLACGERLVTALSDAEHLLAVVPDFPLSGPRR
jgi:spermidine synthase